MKYDKKIIGKRIRELRESYRDEDHKRKLSREEFGYLIKGCPENGSGYDRGTIAAWENGEAQISLDALFEICDFFDCELGYLLGEYDTRKKDTVDIMEKTGLSDKAVDALLNYRSNAESIPEFSFEISLNLESALNKSGLNRFIHKELFIPHLISFMIADPDFEKISDRICSQCLSRLEYVTLIEIEKQIIDEAYTIALQRTPINRTDDLPLLISKYKNAVNEIMTERKDEITEQLPFTYVEGFYEWIYIPQVQGKFHLARAAASDTIKMNSFLNSHDLYNIVKRSIAPVTEIK